MNVFEVGLKEVTTSNKDLNAGRWSPIRVSEVQDVSGKGNSHFECTKNMPAVFKRQERSQCGLSGVSMRRQ